MVNRFALTPWPIKSLLYFLKRFVSCESCSSSKTIGLSILGTTYWKYVCRYLVPNFRYTLPSIIRNLRKCIKKLFKSVELPSSNFSGRFPVMIHSHNCLISSSFDCFSLSKLGIRMLFSIIPGSFISSGSLRHIQKTLTVRRLLRSYVHR